MTALTPTGTNIRTLYPDGTLFIDGGDDDGTLKNTVGEYKRFSRHLESSSNLTGYVIKVNPGLWVPNGLVPSLPTLTNPSDYYTIVYSATPGTYTMNLVSNFSGVNVELERNYKVEIEIIGNTEFIIHVYAYIIQDRLGFLNTTGLDNRKKLLRASIYAASDLVITGTSSNIFTYTGSATQIIVYAFDPIGAGTAFYDYTAWPFKAAWYNTGAPAFPTVVPLPTPDITNPIFELTRSGDLVTNLSNIVDGQVNFTCTDAGAAITKVFMWMIRTDKTDNTVDFLTNYEKGFVNVYLGAAANGPLKGPYVSPHNIGGSDWNCRAVIDAASLVFNAKYRFIAIAYDVVDSEIVFCNSFISDEYTCDALPQYQGDGMTGQFSLGDYQAQYFAPSLYCCIEERMFSILILDYSSDKFKNDIFARLGKVISNDIRRYLTQVELVIYEEYTDSFLGLVRNVFDRKTSTKVNPITYSPNIIGGDGALDIQFPTDGASFLYKWRNRYEENVNCLESYINGVLTVPQLANQDWGAKSLKVEWRLTLFYDDYITPFTDIIKWTGQINVRDYADGPSDDTGPVISNITEGMALDQFTACQGKKMCFKAVIDPVTYLEPMGLIVNIEKDPGNIATIHEAENWVGGIVELPTLLAAEISEPDEELLYGDSIPDTAKWCINTALLTPGDYKMTVFAKHTE